MPDTTITCKDCNRPFIFTEGEQRWFETKGFKPPKRCASCRAEKKAREAQQDDVVDRGYDGDGMEGSYRRRSR